MSNPAASFEPYRRRLLGLAYRMLGSMADAEDAVQETYLRWHAADRDNVSDPRAFLMTTTTRICLDMLTSARARREEYVGPWLPEPVVDTAALAPDSHTERAEDSSIALLLTLDRLSPLERAAFLLHDVFDFSFSEVASALERSEAACRQLAARARARVRTARPRGATVPPARSGEMDAKHAQLMSAFVAATESGDLNALTQLLASDVRVVTDDGGKVRAALNVVDGADRVARFLAKTERERAEEAAALRERLVAIVGHDLRNPLSAISMAAQLLSSHALATADEHLVNQIRRSANRMTRMIGQILDFARIRSGQSFDLRLESADLRQVCQAVIDELRLSKPDQEITLSIEGQTDALIDSDRIAQVLSNLMSNAIQHGTRGPIGVTVHETEPNVVAIEVHNVGPAIPRSALAGLFEAFNRGTAAGNHRSSIGLGLFIAKEIVRAHGGSIVVRSPDRNGTTFSVVLPRRPAIG